MISVIVPVWNERSLIVPFLDDVAPRVRACGGELICVDGGSEDGSAELARDRPDLLWLRCEAGRGRQMNRGAAAAQGSLLAFLPVDTRLEPGAFRELAAIDRRSEPVAGGFRQRFDQTRRFLRLISYLHNLRAGLSGVVYGDQVPFVRRELFLELGGFREGIDMEDVEFGTRLRRRARPALRPFVATTSSRRFDEAGDLRATFDAARLLASWTFRRKIGKSPVFFSPVRGSDAASPERDDSSGDQP